MIGIFRAPRRMEDLALFTRHLAGVMNARAPMAEILRAFASDSELGEFSAAVEDLAVQTEKGVPLATAMEAHPKLFPRAYRRLVQVGEQGGVLGGVMNQMAGNIEEALKIYEGFRRAAIYPIVVATFLLVDLGFIYFKIIPRFVAIFTELGMEMPEPTRMIVGPNMPFLGVLLLYSAPVIAIVLSLLGLRFAGVFQGDIHLSLPLIGPVLRRAETARFANNLSLLLGNHVPLAEALGLLADSSDNGYVRAAIQDFHDRYRAGEALSVLVASQPLFPKTMAAMIAAAEDKGGLAETLGHLGRYYAQRTSHGLAVLRELLEPLLLVIVGVTVGIIIVSLYLPLFYLPRAIG